MLKLYNTESRQKEDIIPNEKRFVFLYTCGPTIYNYAHIGNFRTYIFEDILRRTIRFFGMRPFQVMNITDVDDKTIKGAVEQHIALAEYTEPFEKAFFEDLKTLNIEAAEYYPKATEYIPDMIEIIQGLIAKGFAYRGADGSIYFSISKFPTYGRLSHFKLEDLKVGASSNDEYDKENASDFVLWKSYDPKRDGSIFWESPFGKGRPGWHIECSAMAMRLIGKTVDIHCGGVDNIFPHHENEIAQSEAYSGVKFVKIWAHSAHLVVDGRKMAKSFGNFYTLKDLLKMGYSGREIRYMLLQVHYRVPLNFTFEGLEAAKQSLARLDDFITRLKEISIEPEKEEQIELLAKFSEAIGDDLNISAALASLFDFIREINSLCDRGKLGKKSALQILALLNKIDSILGIITKEEVKIPAIVLEALKEREKARKAKNWKLADEKRNFILSQGYAIEDTHSGARLKSL